MKVFLCALAMLLLSGCHVFESRIAYDAEKVSCSSHDLVGVYAYVDNCVSEKGKNQYCFDRAILALCGKKTERQHELILGIEA